jgi:hypothetical protein
MLEPARIASFAPDIPVASRAVAEHSASMAKKRKKRRRRARGVRADVTASD